MRLEDPTRAREFFEVALGAFQNLSKTEKKELLEYFEGVSKLAYPADLKLQAMAYAVLGVSGEANFNRVMSNMRDYALPPDKRKGASTSRAFRRRLGGD